MTTTFFLLRHAAHDDVGSYLAGRTPNVFLGSAGRAQALRLAERMRRERFAAIISSPRERTQQTAQAVSVTCEVGPVELCNDLDEIDFGSWSGRTFNELSRDPAWRRWNEQRPIAVTPGGESMGAVQKRACACMRALSLRYAGESVVLVSHADVIKCAICNALGLPLDGVFRFDIDPASVSVMALSGDHAKLVRLNETIS
ncbi:histidine phosphatase family protein [Labrys sp. LIt4]|uniref:histidine phosphatase family protein n=1 Tax=Labrys sp. LIt4 TaxID=2821355 RepID=UPI001AE02C4F|nr:histidine phosphatase family protein [Labrys sp. LIt4]MBP0582556.1 histidine phosphatase family protein [Labrys sp. LIt4]